VEELMTEQPQTEAQVESQRQTSGETWEQVIEEMVAISKGWAQQTGKVLENLTGLMVIRADGELRNRLDMLVESGAVASRAEALCTLIQAGVEKKQRLYERIEATKSQIDALKNQLRNLAGGI
jgi:tRNA(Phe) wybutosine-synthesizing methylase Tyw3